jgi:HK97 family phage major capsid protein
MDINAKKQKRSELKAKARALLDAAQAASRGMSPEEEQEFDRMMDEADNLDREILRMERAREDERDKPVEDDPDETTDEQRAAAIFSRYLRHGEKALTEDDIRALNMGHDPEGGFLVAPEQFVTELLKRVDDEVVLRQFATTMQLTEGESLGVPTLETDLGDADWTSEIETGTEDTGMRFGKRSLTPHPLAKRVKISRTLIRRAPSGLSPEELLQQRLAYVFGITQEKAYMVGDGNQKPLGLFTANAAGISTARDVTLGAAGAIPLTVATADQLIDAKYTLKSAYHRNARWLFHRLTFRYIRKVKDTDGQYIWVPGLQRDQADTILESPFTLSEFVPNTIAANGYVGLYGDLSKYWIVDALDMEVQRLNELYAETNQVGFIGRYEGDGMPMLEEAFVRLKVPA